MPEYILGLDTSNYTTSAALVTAGGELVANCKRPLPVKEGERGLRQSDALFAHIKNLPSLMEEIGELRGETPLAAIGVSTRPRNLEGSYMPCFLAGVAAASTAAATAGLPVYSFSHQCGHIMAALYSSGREELLDRSFGAFHLSGGTTELLRVRADGPRGFLCEHLGGTRDLNAGQVIDRVGVAMGLRFPCGPALEQLALQCTRPVPRRRVSSDGCYVNLSGLENIAVELFRDTGDAPLTAAFVLSYLGDAVAAMADAYLAAYGQEPLLFAGGVMSNGILKKRLACYDAAFADAPLSADNAVGVALLAARAHTAT